jgi:glycosyltransferase involved in cell wall biosynthesis
VSVDDKNAIMYKHKKISIITATYNAVKYLPRFISSMRNQTNKNFEWIVVDGGSTDGTLGFFEDIVDLKLVIDSRSDFGIYDALNRGIKLCSGDYYLVLGVDDILYPDSMKIIHAALQKTDSDIYSFLANSENGIDVNAKRKWPFFYSQRAYIGAHSVGTIIRKKLHEQFGYYSKRFPIAADQYFIKQACDAGATVEYIDKSIGIFGSSGLSSVDTLGQLTESLRVQIATGERKSVQLLLFFLRILKNYKKF